MFNGHSSEGMVIMGEPGLGKTLTTESIVNQLASTLEFTPIFINMKMIERPEILYSAIT